MPISAAGSKPLAGRPVGVRAGGDRRGFTSLRRSAEHGFTSLRRSAEHGFTLVELMVVVTIIGLASAVAVFVMPDPRGRVFDEATRFAARVRAAHDSAIVEARPVSVWITGGGYGFDRRLAGGWTPISEKPLRVERWTEGTRATIGDLSGRVRVTFDPTGLVDRPATVALSRGGAEASVTIDADGSVRADAR